MAIDRSILVRPVSRLLAAAGLALLFACSQQTATTPVTPAGTAAKPEPTSSQAASAKPSGPAQLPAMAPPRPEPPDGKWLTDEKDREYFIEEVPMVEGWYHWMNEEKTQVRLWHGMLFDAVSHDEDSIRIKIYRVFDTPPSAPPQTAEAAAVDKEKIAAAYSNETGAADRLTFEPYGKGLPSRGQWRNGFKVADMNGDGNPDIVHGPSRKSNGNPNIFLGDGKGNWHRWAEARFPAMGLDYGDVAVADFNGDGRPDLALASHLRGLVVLVADGPASFKEWSQGIYFEIPGQGGDSGGFTSRSLETADWNGDGRPDLIALGEGPRMAPAAGARRAAGAEAYGVRVYLNQGDGTWTHQDELKQGVRLFGEDLAVVDFTNDRQLDIVLGSSVLGEKEILRIGGPEGSWTKAPLAELRPRGYVGAVDAADFNGDGRIDLAVGFLSREGNEWRTGIDVFLARADGGWERKGVAVEDTRDWLTALDSGDLDGDGRIDLAATTGDGEVWIFLGQGNGSFLREESPEVPPSQGGCRGYDIQIVNLDGDPAEELVAEFAGEPSAMFAPTLCLEEGSLTAWKPRARK